eukprot:COSAG01_NODE_689_length_14220_cov_363.812903_3_plen_57_part_00
MRAATTLRSASGCRLARTGSFLGWTWRRRHDAAACVRGLVEVVEAMNLGREVDEVK